jgi:hypothetical protein
MTNRTLFATLQKFLVVTSIFVLTGCTTNKQENSEWITLFNGKDLDDWVVKIQHYDVGVNFGNTFSVQDSVIDVRYDAYGEFNDRFGHLFYKTPFSKFHLKLEYRLAGALQPGAPSYTILNSGVMFHSQDPATIKKEQDWPISVEMQFLAGLEDGNERPTGNMCSPGTEIYYQGQKYNGHCLQSSSKTYPPGQWVKAELIVFGDSLITHIINGDTVLQYSKPTIGGGVVARYDSAIFQEGKPLTGGFIGLQSEGQPVQFRNIFLKEL